MDRRELLFYLLLPEHHPGLGDTDLLDLVASRVPADVWRARIAAQGTLAVAFEHARWLTTQDEAPLSIPENACSTRIFSFKHGVLAFTLNDLLRWFVDHGCVESSEVEVLPADPPPTPPDWTPNVARRPVPEPAEPPKHWLFGAEDPYAVLEAMGDTPERPVLTIGYNDSEEPYRYVVVPVHYVLDSCARADELLEQAAAERDKAATTIDPHEDEDDDSDAQDHPELDFDRFYESLPPFPREEHDAWMPGWLHEHLERSVPRLATDRWEWDHKTGDETFRAMAAALHEAGFVVTDENLVPSVATWVYRYEGLGLG